MVKIIEDVGTVGYGLLEVHANPSPPDQPPINASLRTHMVSEPAPEEQAFGATEAVYGNGAILWNGGQI
ncbi:hypothetical protein MMC22_010786 [Lobaria immixta]|nr:hypothetical protein [Lobaria immixta]